MSMYVSVARVSKAQFDRIQAEPGLIESIFFDGDGGGDSLELDGGATAGFDYRIALEGLEAMAEATGEDLGDGDAVLDDLGVTGELGWDAGYGPAFYVEPKAVKKTAVHSAGCHIDDDVAKVIKAAAAAGEYIVGVIS